QGLTGVDVHTGDAAAVARALAKTDERFDFVVVNPPRRGLGPGVRRAIAQLAPRAVAYVSCDPDTLAPDLADLAWLGYRARALHPVDMIPLTDHVEVVALLEPCALPAPRVLFDDGDFCAIVKRGYPSPAEREPRRILWSPDADESGPLVWRRETTSE